MTLISLAFSPRVCEDHGRISHSQFSPTGQLRSTSSPLPRTETRISCAAQCRKKNLSIRLMTSRVLCVCVCVTSFPFNNNNRRGLNSASLLKCSVRRCYENRGSQDVSGGGGVVTAVYYTHSGCDCILCFTCPYVFYSLYLHTSLIAAIIWKPSC